MEMVHELLSFELANLSGFIHDPTLRQLRQITEEFALCKHTNEYLLLSRQGLSPQQVKRFLRHSNSVCNF